MDEERNNVSEESRGLTFKDILFIIRKHWIAIICFIVACTAAGFIWSKVEPPVYSSTGSMLVSYESGSTTLTQDYTFSNYISSTYVSFIKENVVMDKVSEKLKAEGKEFTTGQLKNNTSVSNNALIIKVSFKSNDPEVAKQVAQTIMEVAQEVANTEEGGKAVYHLLHDNLKVLSDAKNGVKVSHTLRNTAIGLAAGVVLALVYIVIRELSDNTFKSSEEIERILNLPVLAGIPDYHFDDEKKGGK